MTAETLRELRSMVVNECACFLRIGPGGIPNHCYARKITRERFICVMWQDDFPRCWWLEKCVLPLDEELADQYYREVKNGGSIANGAAVDGVVDDEQGRGRGHAGGGDAIRADIENAPTLSTECGFGLGAKKSGNNRPAEIGLGWGRTEPKRP